MADRKFYDKIILIYCILYKYDSTIDIMSQPILYICREYIFSRSNKIETLVNQKDSYVPFIIYFPRNASIQLYFLTFLAVFR